MEEEKTAAAGSPHTGCLFCTILPMIEQRLSEAGQGISRTPAPSF